MKPAQFISDQPLPLRETIARAIYDVRPFTMARSGGVMQPIRVERVFDWEGAPAFYQNECYELADAIAARLLLGGN